MGCITLPEDNVKTCDVPPLGVVDMDTLRSFSEVRKNLSEVF